MSRTNLMSELTWTEYQRRLKEDSPVVMLPVGALEHAAVMETSISLHIHPRLVHMERMPDDPPADFPPYDMYPTIESWVPPSGVLSSARTASAEKGKALFEEYVISIATALTREFGAQIGVD